MAQTANNTHTTAPDGYGMNGNNGIPEGNLVLSYPAAAATTYYARDLVTVSTSANTISKCTGKSSIFDGIVLQGVDNSLGAASDRYVPVGVKGIFEFNSFVEASGQTETTAITYQDLVYLSADSAGVGAGQKVTAYDSSSTLVGRSFDATTTIATDANTVSRVYINALSKSLI